jgi:LPXTG-motif cell wall-anchored protein
VIVSSGGATVELDDVESVAFGVTTATLPLPLGSTIEVSLRLGPDEIYSGGLLVTIDCPLVGPDTTATDTTSPDTTSPDTTSPDTTSPDTTSPRGVSSGEQTQSPTLPATGPDDTVWATIAAMALLAVGGSLVALARRPR